MAARLVHEGYDTSRMYEWSWIEREKDHRAVDIRIIGLLPITPFSTLAVWPGRTAPPRRETHLDSAESRLSRSYRLDAADNDWPKLSANRTGDIPELPAASQPAVWTILCASTVADHRGVFQLSPRIPSSRWRLGVCCCNVQGLPTASVRVFP